MIKHKKLSIQYLLERFDKQFIKGVAFVICSFFNSAINFILVTVLAFFLQVEDFGILNLYITFLTVVSIFISFNTTSYIQVCYFRYSRAKFIDSLQCIYLTTLVILFIGLLLIVLINLIFPFFKTILGIDLNYQLIALFSCFFQAFYLICMEVWRIKERIKSYVFHSIINMLLNVILTIILVGYYKYNWEGRVYAQLIISIMYFIISIYYLYKMNLISITRKIRKEIFYSVFSYSIPLIPHNASSWIRQGVDRYILNFYTTEYQVGLFSFAFSFSNIIHIVGASFNSSNSVMIYKQLNNASDIEQSKRNMRKMIKRFILFYVVMTIFIICALYVGIKWFFLKYEPSLVYLIPLCISSLAQCIYYLYVNFLFYYKKTKQLMYITFGFSILHLSLAIILVPISDVYLGYIYLIINCLITITVYFQARKYINGDESSIG